MKHLTKEQRYTISQMKSQGYKQQDIADVIVKDKSVVSRELKRNCDMRSSEYKADLAQRKYEQRQKNKPKKIRITETVKQLVNTWLKCDYSPEQIAGRAKIEGRGCVSHERIYQYVWQDKKNAVKLHLHLRRKGSSFENITNQQIQYAQHKLNNRPRKKLGFFSC